jgi:hypothetical protein
MDHDMNWEELIEEVTAVGVGGDSGEVSTPQVTGV